MESPELWVKRWRWMILLLGPGEVEGNFQKPSHVKISPFTSRSPVPTKMQDKDSRHSLADAGNFVKLHALFQEELPGLLALE
jgi:hypothetical protein